jgi:hypothetical protein
MWKSSCYKCDDLKYDEFIVKSGGPIILYDCCLGKNIAMQTNVEIKVI